jgi:TRAP-type C4-dicarboxylate transport system substrate-binding protein
VKKIFLPIFAIVLVVALLLTACGPKAPQEVIYLAMANYLPVAHPFTALQEQFGKDIEARTNGQVVITYYPGGSLLTAPNVPDGLEQGIADIAFSHIGYNRGRFPVSESLDLPMGYPTGWVGSHVATDFMNKFKPAEWDSLHLLLVNAGCTAGLMLHNTKVTKLEDLKGKTLRGAGEVADAIAALGATPRDIPMIEMYDSVSKGVVDGTLVGIETLKSFKMAEVCKYTAFAWQVGNMYTFYIAMNKDKWDAMPKNIQDIFTDVSVEYAEKYAELWNQIDVDGINYSLSIPGNEVYKLTDAEGQRWHDAVQPVIGNYVTAMADKGFNDAQSYVDYIQDRIAYWTPREADQNISSPFDVNLPTEAP